MTETVYARGEGGAIFRLDVPPPPGDGAKPSFARERWDAKIERGDLVVIPDDEIEERVVDGATVYVHVSSGARADAVTAVDLAARAAELGIDVDKRWGTKRLAAEVAKAEQAAADRVVLEARARELFDDDELEAIDVMSDEDLAAAIAAAEAED